MTMARSRTSTQAAVKSISRSTSDFEGSVPIRAPRIGHKKSRQGCAQCKRRHVKCDEESPCSNCVRHGVACSLDGGPNVPREDAKPRRSSRASSSASGVSQGTSQDLLGLPTAGSDSDSRGASPRRQSFFRLTGTIDRPSPSEAKNWMSDLQLMHHYRANTARILTLTEAPPFIIQIWQDEMPKVAFEQDYVMHGLLGFTALHKAHLEPENAIRLRASAVDHLDKALVLYRSETGPTTAENASAKFIFTWLVALFAYAIPPSLPPIDAVVELFMLVKGIDASLADTGYWVAQGPFAALLPGGFEEALSTPDTNYSLPDGMDFGLNHLDYMLGVDAMLPDDRRTCALILSELKQVYDSVLQKQSSCSVALILCFPKADPVKFAQLIKRRVPQVLIMLAYCCVLLNILDARWWIHGWSRRVLSDVVDTLDQQWRQWIEWPIQSVLTPKQSLPVAMDVAAFVI